MDEDEDGPADDGKDPQRSSWVVGAAEGRAPEGGQADAGAEVADRAESGSGALAPLQPCGLHRHHVHPVTSETDLRLASTSYVERQNR